MCWAYNKDVFVLSIGSGGEAGENGRKLECLIRRDLGSKTCKDGRKLNGLVRRV